MLQMLTTRPTPHSSHASHVKQIVRHFPSTQERKDDSTFDFLEDPTKNNKNWSFNDQDSETAELSISEEKSEPLFAEKILEKELNTCLTTGNYIPKIIKIKMDGTDRVDYFLDVINFEGRVLSRLSLGINLDQKNPIKIITTLPDCQLVLHTHTTNSGSIIPAIVPITTYRPLLPLWPPYKTIAYSPNKSYLIGIYNDTIFLFNKNGNVLSTYPMLSDLQKDSIHILHSDKILILSGSKGFTFDIDLSKNPPNIINQRKLKENNPLKYALQVQDFPNHLLAIVNHKNELHILKAKKEYDEFTNLFQIKDYNPEIIPQKFNEFLFYFNKTNILIKLNMNSLEILNLGIFTTPSHLYINRQGHVVMDGKILHTVAPMSTGDLDNILARNIASIPKEISFLVASYINKLEDLFFPTAILELNGSERLSLHLRDKLNEIFYQFAGEKKFEKNKVADKQLEILKYLSSRLCIPEKPIVQCIMETEMQFSSALNLRYGIDVKLKDLFKQIKLETSSVRKHGLFTKHEGLISRHFSRTFDLDQRRNAAI